MILQANRKPFSGASRLWRFVVLSGMMAAVLGLSLVTVRPTASAQEDGEITETRQRKPPAAKKRKKNKSALRAQLGVKTAPAESGQAIELSMQIVEVDQRKLAEAKLSSDEIIEQAVGGRCQMVDGVIVCAHELKSLAGLIDQLKERDLATIVSAPKVITLDGEEATVQIGSEVPLVQVEETVNGKSSSRVEYKSAGVLLTIKPTLSRKTSTVDLEVAIEHSRLLPSPKDPAAPPIFKTQRLKVGTDVELGRDQAVLLAEPQPKGGKADSPATTLLMVITPIVRVLPVESPARPKQVFPAPPLPQTSAHAEQLAPERDQLLQENDHLRKQIAELRKQLDDIQAKTAQPASEASERIVVYALQNTPAKRVMEVIKQLRDDGRSNVVLKAIALDERTNSIVIRGNQEQLVIVGNMIAAIDKAQAPSKTAEPNLPATAAEGLEKRLHDLDLREAEIKLRAAQSNLERVQALAQTNPTVTKQDFTSSQFEVDKATLEIEALKSGGDPLVKQKTEVRLAELRLRQAQFQLERMAAIVKQGEASQGELEAIQFEVEKAGIDLERARAKLEAAPAATSRPGQ